MSSSAAIDARTSFSGRFRRGLVAASDSDPFFLPSRSLLASFDNGCAEEVISIAAICQVNSIFNYARSATQVSERDIAIADLVHPTGDHMTFARIFANDDWKDANACSEMYLNQRALRKADEVRQQLRGFMRRLGSVSRLPSVGTEGDREVSLILKSLVKGHVFNCARMGTDGKYRTLRGSNVVDVCATSLFGRFGKYSEYVIFSYTEDSAKTLGNLQIVNVSAVDGNWLLGNR